MRIEIGWSPGAVAQIGSEPGKAGMDGDILEAALVQGRRGCRRDVLAPYEEWAGRPL